MIPAAEALGLLENSAAAGPWTGGARGLRVLLGDTNSAPVEQCLPSASTRLPACTVRSAQGGTHELQHAINKHTTPREQYRTHFLDQTARKPKVRLETMAEMKPVQLKVRSDADASATPVCTTTQPHTSVV